MKVIVIGAGAAGLAATHALRKAGADVAAFEASPYAGGRARCYRKDGFIFDTGAQFMAKVCTTQLRLCLELGLGDEIFTFDLKTSHWRDGRIYPMPTMGNPRKFIQELPDLFKFRGLPLKVYPQMARLAFHLIKRYMNVDIAKMNAECLLDLGDTSVADFTLRYGGQEALDWVMAPMASGLTLGEAEEVSIPHIISLMGLYGGLLLLQRGIGSLPEALYQVCKDSIRLNTPVKKVVIENQAVRGVETEEGFIPADHVICATTASMARKLMPDLPDGMRKPLETVRYSQTAHVMLALRKRLLPGGIYILTLPRPARSFMPALNDCSEKSAYFAPPGTGLSHCVTYGRRAREFQNLPDGQIIDKVIEEARRFVPLASQDIIMAEVVRWDEAICLESPGEFPAMYCLKRNHLDDVQGLHLAGEYMYLTSCVEGALRSGEDAAAAALAKG